jgi:alkanesulfonate monooxygenase SsuD/methylene tetrahydromethanopterin reductase-like flavin-dependent oxidoreductase (luciferase family)
VYSVAQAVCCGRDESEVKRRADAIGQPVEQLRENGLAGTPAEIVDKIGRFAGVGCDRVYLQVLDPTDLDHIELLATDVLSQV